MLYLLDKDAKTVKWNGIPLHEASSAVVKEETNGDFYLTVHYPITDSGIYQLIKEDMLIKAPTPVLGPQLFRIKKPVENDDSLDITAYHISDDVMQRSIRPVSVVGQGCAMALSQMVQNAKTDLGTFSFTSDIMDSRTFNTTETETLYSVLLDGKHSIVGTWEGELVRDNFALSIKRSRGADRGVVITTHKNLKSYQRTKNSQGVVTRIHARSTFRAEGAETDTVLTVTVDSPLIGNYPYINEKEYENNDAKTIDELKKWAEAKFANEGIDKVSDAIEIEAYELDGQVVHLGDTVNIKSIKHDVDLYKKAIAYEYNALTEEYISITFDDKPGVGGSGVSSGVSNAADVILSANRNAQEVAIERAVKNANQAFDAEFDKRVEVINNGIEQFKAEAELYADNIKQNIDTEIAQVNQSMQAQSEEHDRQVADILSKTQSVESLANQAKTDAASAMARANQVKTEAIADARAQVATVSQALNTAKTDLQNQVNAVDAKAVKVQSDATTLRTDLNQQAQTILSQAQAQTALTSRVSTVETLADGTRSTVAELSKTVSKATGDIASVSSRTKTVEDTLTQTRTQYEVLSQTVNAQTGQIESINRKTADLQSGIDGVTERFEEAQVGAVNLVRDSKINETSNVYGFGIRRVRLETGKKYWFGARARKNGGTTDKKTRVYLYSYDWTEARILEFSSDEFTEKFTQFIPTRTQEYLISSYWFPQGGDRSGNAEVVWYMVTEGTFRPSTWTPAEEDLRSEIAEYKRTADQNYAGLQSTVSTLDGKVTQNKTEANQTATQLSNRLTSLETYKDGESTRAQSYFEASKTETAKQITAERTAIASNYVAKSIYDEDARGTTLKLNEIKTTADTAKQNLATYQETVDRKLTELTSSTQTLDGKINTASTKVDTVAGQIRTEISETKALIPSGGTNLLRKSSVSDEYLKLFYSTNGATVEVAEKDGRRAYKVTAGSSGSYIAIYHNNDVFNLFPDETYVFSYRIYSSVDIPFNFGNFGHTQIVNPSVSGDLGLRQDTERFYSQSTIKANQWQQVYLTFKPISISYFRAFLLNIPVGSHFYICDLQLEKGKVPSSTHSPAPEDFATVTALHAVNDTVDSHTRTIGAVGTTGSILDNVSKVTQTANGLVTEVSGANGLKTQVSTLAGSYAIKSLTKAGDVLGQINLNKDGSIKLDGSLIQITGKTYIQDGVISAAKIGDLDAGKIKTGTLDAARIATNSITGSHIVFDQAFVNKMTANEALFKQLFAQSAFITSVQAVTLSASQITGGILTATNAAMEVNLNAGQILYYTDQAALKRVLDGYPTQFIKFGIGTQSTDNAFRLIGAGSSSIIGASIASFGTNRNNGENNLDGGFTGVNIYSGGTTGTNVVDRIELASDILQIAHAASTGIANDPRGWTFENQNSVNNNYVFRPNTRPNSAYKALIGTSATPVNELYIDEAYIKGQRLGWILKDIANRIGHSGWANNIA